MVRWLSRFFNYLDRYYIQRHNLHNLNDVGLQVFKGELLGPLPASAPLRGPFPLCLPAGPSPTFCPPACLPAACAPLCCRLRGLLLLCAPAAPVSSKHPHDTPTPPHPHPHQPPHLLAPPPPLPPMQQNAINNAGGIPRALNTVAAVPGGAPEVAKAAEAMGGLDGVVNAAGILSEAGIADTTAEVFARTLAVNLTGTFLVIQAAAPFIQAATSSLMRCRP